MKETTIEACRPLISVVIPVYKCADCLIELTNRLQISLDEVSKRFEILLVDDWSPDNSWEIIQDLAHSNPTIKGIRLSKNFGQHYAIAAGVDQVLGDWLIVMDGDLQDLPEEIPNLYKVATEGDFDVVMARRRIRRDAFLKKEISRLFYRVLSYLTDSRLDPAIANFGIYRRNVVSVIRDMTESIRYFPSMVRWSGFSQTTLDVTHGGRPHGESAYSVKKLLSLGIDVILAYSDKPLKLTVKFGFFLSISSLVFVSYIVFQRLTGQIEVLGYSTIVASVWLLSGVIIFIQGILGLYVGKIFECTKARPVYIISKTVNMLENKPSKE
ncbi:glycosyltransferase family 2 protein [Pseudobacteriovorax antillogorgiicola]|uniref:Dolichol-phosphate mannosyltransferase n=1 Tax=Pseudobacteriovorax antillogorgiicola TaxID=1513793 RepID=A0A1Y6CM19_9BACT|nr:glycosyltransferase family 2 protein [Pseudobacteriovorax antillogorgiicola]TCS45178.1 dolichol-phosphate mannosyltransferase [Pseudobacteriovorax antillogorgiicola]SMF75746.1 dolichol-phosphate mannosyltransferase [Pseudobacteriovorax antillogorgiicola]